MPRRPQSAPARRRVRPSFFRRLLHKLWSGFRVVMIALPAFGPSAPPPPPPPPPPLEAQAEDGQAEGEQR